MKAFLCILLSLASLLMAVEAGVDTVVVARSVAAEKFSGFTYGDDVRQKKINCVQFVGEVVSRLLRRPLTKAEIDAIYINAKFENISHSVDVGDELTKGVSYALTKVLKCGHEVNYKDAKSGDFVQYWIKKKNGEWMGHSALISKVWIGDDGVNRAAIYGANQSTNGIAETAFKGNEGLRLYGGDRRVYIVRFEAP